MWKTSARLLKLLSLLSRDAVLPRRQDPYGDGRDHILVKLDLANRVQIAICVHDAGLV